ncbi:hypothetical protein CTAYLR_005316 [Chrysophaeum taylorii]|uniref:ABC transporter domain-containing protein n=1 Tax=Chrysophaeum taylorii TaxID=2483200 RepID=A0AAD7UKZ0_9STRA|nr:hypothetical protein CTAYLR_005316 [Chrysophaeum taylorii]
MEAKPLLAGSKNGAVVCVEDLWYARSVRKAWHIELCGINLVARPGEVWGCMGRSGPWMTSLMELLAVQRSEGWMSGRITYDGYAATARTRHVATLVSRENHFSCVSALTVREIVAVSARLRNASEALVDETIDLLGLRKCAHVRIGSETIRGISGGEKKRLAIALGLVAQPRLVLLNEPTTGLDSTTALDVMRHVHDSVAHNQGRTVVATLHTPSADVFARCDKLLLVTTAGRVAWAGPAADVIAHLRGVVPTVVDADDGGLVSNPADAVLAVASAPGASRRLAAAFAKSNAGQASLRAVATAQGAPGPRPPDPEVSHADAIRQVRALLWRSVTQFARSRSIWLTSLFKMAWIGFLYSTTFKDQPKNAEGAANLESCFYFALMFGILGNLRGIVTLFDERALFEHERANGAYSPFVYWFVASVAQVPWLIFVNVLFSTLVFFSVGGAKVQGTLWVWAWYLLVTQFTNLVGFAWAQMLAAWTSSPQVAMSVWQPGVYIWAQTSGYPIKLPVISHTNPAYWLMFVSFTRWAYEAIVVGFFHAGWGTLSRHDVLSEFGYPTTSSLWFLLMPIILFIFIIRFVTYPPLRGTRPKLRFASTSHDLEKMAPDFAETVGKAASVAIAIASDAVEFNKSDDKLFEEVRVDVHPLWYSVRVVDANGEKTVKPLLFGVGATVAPGELLAVMGPSGAGKSTFLDVISGRKTTGFGRGSVAYNGATPTRLQRHKLQCYVMQHDVLIPNLTVAETVRIASMLRLDAPASARVAERASGVIAMLGLDGCAATLVRGLATGERRLCAAAVEMVHLPSVMYLDEPTSGLDSKMSLDFVRAMMRLVERRATLVCTIHQPSEPIFRLFPKVLVIGDGRAVFSGTPAEAAARMMQEMPERAGQTTRNAAEWLLDAAAAAGRSKRDVIERQDGLLEPVADGFDLDRPLGGATGCFGGGDDEDTSCESVFGGGGLLRQFYHFRVHLLRNLLVLSHSRQAIFIALLRNICVAVWYGVVYDDQTNMHSLASVNYFSQQFITMSNLQAIPTMFTERPLLYREVSAGFYTVLPYLAARCALNAIVQIPLVLVYCVITYPMVNMRGGLFSLHFVFFYMVMFGLSLAGYSFSNFIAAITPNQQSALNLYSALFQFSMFFCGYAIPIDQVPTYWSWAPKFSFARWSFEALILNEFDGIDDDDDGAGAEYWLKYWNFNGANKYRVFAVFVLQVSVFHVLALLAMRLVSYQKT